MPTQAKCPTCGAPIAFRPGTMVAVCGYCKSLSARTDRDPRLIGQVADLVDTGSPLRVGLTGTYAGRRFSLVGRTQLSHPLGGVWDEWYLALEDGRWGWLAQAQGRYCLTFKHAVSASIPAADALVAGGTVDLGDQGLWQIAEVSLGTFASAEGEIPWEVELNGVYRFADLSGPNGAFATLDYSEEPPLFFTGREIPFEDLKLKLPPPLPGAGPKLKTQGPGLPSMRGAPACARPGPDPAGGMRRMRQPAGRLGRPAHLPEVPAAAQSADVHPPGHRGTPAGCTPHLRRLPPAFLHGRGHQVHLGRVSAPGCPAGLPVAGGERWALERSRGGGPGRAQEGPCRGGLPGHLLQAVPERGCRGGRRLRGVLLEGGAGREGPRERVRERPHQPGGGAPEAARRRRGGELVQEHLPGGSGGLDRLPAPGDAPGPPGHRTPSAQSALEARAPAGPLDGGRLRPAGGRTGLGSGHPPRDPALQGGLQPPGTASRAAGSCRSRARGARLLLDTHRDQGRDQELRSHHHGARGQRLDRRGGRPRERGHRRCGGLRSRLQLLPWLRWGRPLDRGQPLGDGLSLSGTRRHVHAARGPRLGGSAAPRGGLQPGAPLRHHPLLYGLLATIGIVLFPVLAWLRALAFESRRWQESMYSTSGSASEDDD